MGAKERPSRTRTGGKAAGPKAKRQNIKNTNYKSAFFIIQLTPELIQMPFTNELLRYANPYFVETGSFKGDTIDIVNKSGLFKNIYSIEYSKEYYDAVCDRFKDSKNVTIFNGTSKTDLWEMIRNIDTPITFWLDAHWTGGQVANEDPVLICPILDELEQIKKHPIKTHTIMVDDMRLMNGRDFPINISNILTKILEINPNYKFIGYNDSECAGDILVAFIEQPPPFCIHSYVTKREDNKLAPGFGDFLRGTIALYYLTKKYNYKLYIDSQSHPLFEFLKENPHFIKANSKAVIDFTPNSMPISYEKIEESLINKLESKESFSCLTNSYYTRVGDALGNWGPITEDCAAFMKQILQPNDCLKKQIFNAYKEMNLDTSRGYAAVHMRFGDEALNDKKYNIDASLMVSNVLKKIIQDNPRTQIVFLCDSNIMANQIQAMTPGIFYWNSRKVHLGLLDDTSAILNTMVDFFILANADTILANRSGFAVASTVIFNKQFINIL